MKPIKLPPELDVSSFHGSGEGYCLIDTRFFPISIMVWKKEPTEDLMHNYYAWRLKASKHAAEHGGLHIVIKDLGGWGVPPATVRAVIGEYAKRDSAETGFGWRFLLVSNPIMRGAITAIAWIKGENSAYTFTKSIPQSIAAAQKMYAERGLEWVDGLDPDSYEFPDAELEAKKKA